MLALRGRNAALLSSLSAHSTSDGLDTRIAWAHRANARASQINPFADLAGRAARLGLGVAKLEQGGHVVKTVCDRRLPIESIERHTFIGPNQPQQSAHFRYTSLLDR